MAKIKESMKLTSLPVWAQDYIADLELERNQAVRVLNDHIQAQEPSPIFVDEYPCTGERQGPVVKRLYIKSHRITIEHAGVFCNVSCDEEGTRHDEAIRIAYGRADGSKSSGGVALMATGMGEITLISKHNLTD